MHVFEMPLHTQPSMIILFDGNALANMLLSVIIDAAPADDLGEQHENWNDRSRRAPRFPSPAPIRTFTLGVAQAMVAERRAGSGLSIREFLALARELGDTLMLPGFAEPYPQLQLALENFVAAVPVADEEHPNAGVLWDAPSKVNCDQLMAIFDRCATDCVPGGELQTMDELQIFMDRFLAEVVAAL